MSAVAHLVLYGVSGACCAAACLLVALLFWRHLRAWTDPGAQSLTLRILPLAPLYALCALVSLLVPRVYVYVDAARDLYEAYALVQFARLQLHHFYRRGASYFGLWQQLSFEEKHGGARDATHAANLEALLCECEPVRLCCGALVVWPSLETLAWIERAVSQYALVRLGCALLSIGLYESGRHAHRSLDPAQAYFWVCAVANASLSLAIAAVLLLCALLERVIWAHDPLLKFGSLKFVIFLVFWQSVALSALAYTDVLPLVYFAPWPAARVVDALDNTLVCVEMAALALVHLWVWRADEPQRTSALWATLRETL